MEQLVSDFGGVVDQLNPLSRQNQIVYLVWLVSYVFLLGAVWRCGRRWLRLVFLILVQLLSVGLFVSQANIVILAIYLWQESLALAAVAMLFSIWAFRERNTLYLTLADTYAELPSIVAGIEAGDYSRLRDFFRVDDYDPEPEAPRYALGYFLAHVCNDMGRNRPTPKDSLAAVRREPGVIGFEPPWLCAWWGEDGDVPAAHNDAPVSDTPALALHGQMDPCCGPRWSHHLKRTMPSLQHVVFRALGHNPVNDCRSKIIRAFLDQPHRAVDDDCRNEVPLEPWVIDDPRSAQADPGRGRPRSQ